MPVPTQEVVKRIVMKIVDFPDKVDVLVIDEGKSKKGWTFKKILIKTVPEDRGKVIGKGGRNINAIRTLVEPMGIMEKVSYSTIDVGTW